MPTISPAYRGITTSLYAIDVDSRNSQQDVIDTVTHNGFDDLLVKDNAGRLTLITADDFKFSGTTPKVGDTFSSDSMKVKGEVVFVEDEESKASISVNAARIVGGAVGGTVAGAVAIIPAFFLAMGSAGTASPAALGLMGGAVLTGGSMGAAASEGIAQEVRLADSARLGSSGRGAAQVSTYTFGQKFTVE